MESEPVSWRLIDFSAIDPVRCPCGLARRGFSDVPNGPMTLHRVEIAEDAKPHFHKRQTEIYYFLDCPPGAMMELDGKTIEVCAGMSVMIPPGVRHCAVGKMTILNIVIPKFDPEDEWYE